MLAARTTGRLFRQLEVCDLRSLRAYYHSLVGSQLYDLSCVNFPFHAIKRARKIFLQEVFNLPDSFPIELASILLGVSDPEIIAFDARCRFVSHLTYSPTAIASSQAMLLNRTLLLPRNVGWNYEFFATAPSAQRLSQTNLTSPSEVAGLRENLTEAVSSTRSDLISSSRSFPHVQELFPSGSIDSSFGQFLGQIPFECSRIVIIFIGNLTRFSFLRTPDRRCPFCNATLYSNHLFSCDTFARDSHRPISWSTLVRFFVEREWRQATSYLFTVLGRWESATTIFRAEIRDRVSSYFDHLRSMRNGTITLPTLDMSSAVLSF